jgi:hypothetical protein
MERNGSIVLACLTQEVCDLLALASGLAAGGLAPDTDRRLVHANRSRGSVTLARDLVRSKIFNWVARVGRGG